MRKNKSKLMAFSLLALCVACLAFGVYALKNATLTVSGTVGFTAHDCMVNVKAYIEGDGITADGTTATDGHPSEERALTFRNVDSNEITVGGESSAEWDKTGEIKDVIYFTDLTDSGNPAPITMTFKLTNLSAYDVYAKIANETDLLAKGVTVVVSDEVVMQESNYTATDEAVLTAIFTLDTSKLDENGLMEGFELKLDFGKYVDNNQGGEEGDEVVTGGIDLNNLPQSIEGLTSLFQENEYECTVDTSGDFCGAPEMTMLSDNDIYHMFIFAEDDESQSMKSQLTEAFGSAASQFPNSTVGSNGNVVYIKSPVTEDRTKEVSADGNFVFLKDAEGNYTLTEYLGTNTVVNLPETAPDGVSTYVLGEYFETQDEGQAYKQTKWDLIGYAFASHYSGGELWNKNYNVFAENSNVTQVNIPANVTKIGCSFYKATALETITIADGSLLTNIGWYAFQSARALTSIELPEGLEVIGEEAFSECFPYDNEGVIDINITLPDSIKRIGEYAFNSALIDSLYIPSTLESMSSNAITNAIINTDATEIPESWNLIKGNKYVTINLAVGTDNAKTILHYNHTVSEVIDAENKKVRVIEITATDEDDSMRNWSTGFGQTVEMHGVTYTEVAIGANICKNLDSSYALDFSISGNIEIVEAEAFGAVGINSIRVTFADGDLPDGWSADWAKDYTGTITYNSSI